MLKFTLIAGAGCCYAPGGMWDVPWWLSWGLQIVPHDPNTEKIPQFGHFYFMAEYCN